MISGIFDVLTSIGDFFVSIGTFIGDFLSDLVSFVTNLTSVGGQVTSLLTGLPAYLITGIASLIVIMVLLRVLGRD